ncbi:fimbria/pilus periplasmic chaperone [Pantoea sp. 1.19]|uniref:fimbria/pilus periplasmic chaperone n=1 Tax=Pantoea sp. 1.19 TaxID=1925589 RepID=UPI0009F96212|nr:fimbria/pilus periplasmic chaperone [Pantoea sp. 1.19]
MKDQYSVPPVVITPSRHGKIITTLLLAAWIAPAAQAAIALDRTRIVFDGGQQSVSLSVSNENKSLPYLAQGWIEDPQGNKIQGPLTVLPPVQRIEPGQPSQVKVQALPAARQLPQDRETVYYFNLREIPPKSAKPNTLQIALQTRIKLFYRPASIAIDPNAPPPQEKLTLSRQGAQYILHNPTPYYVTIVDAGSSAKQAASGFKPLMVAPKESQPLNVSAAALGDHPVLTYVNDYGGRPQLHFRCGGSNCSVTNSNQGH